MVYEDSAHMVFLDKYPVVRGHTLVIPKTHYATLQQMNPKSVGELFSLVPVVAGAVMNATHTSAFNVGQNNGHAAKQVVPHVHVHIIPRQPNDRIDWKARMLVSDSSFRSLAQKIRSVIKASHS